MKISLKITFFIEEQKPNIRPDRRKNIYKEKQIKEHNQKRKIN